MHSENGGVHFNHVIQTELLHLQLIGLRATLTVTGQSETCLRIFEFTTGTEVYCQEILNLLVAYLLASCGEVHE